MASQLALVTYVFFLTGCISSSAATVQLNDGTCALQTMSDVGQDPEAGSSPATGAEERAADQLPELPSPASVNGSQRLAYPRTLADCPTSATIHTFEASFGYELVAGGLKFVYTLAPAAAPPPGNAGIGRIVFSFPTCTCRNPDMFTALELTDKTMHTPINFTEGCGNAGNGPSTAMTLRKIRDDVKPGGTYTVGFTLGYPILGIGSVDLSLTHRGEEYKSQICAPMCTPPPTPAPTETPTASPTASPTTDPTGSPTALPTASPTVVPTASPTVVPTGSPTLPPATPSPTPADEATSFGDPHVANLKGQKFDILASGNHTFLVIPRGADEASSLLHVVARVDPMGPPCRGLLYLTGLAFRGAWLGAMGSMELSTTPDAGIDARKAIRIKVGGSDVEVPALETAAHGLAKVTEFQQERPSSLNQHVTTLLVTLKWGSLTAKVRMVYQKEKDDFSNSLWFTASGLKSVEEEIGGILGLDGHEFVSAQPSQCVGDAHGGAHRLSAPAPTGAVHALAEWSEAGDEA